ncbi:MAG: cold shock domain-containing protein [Mycobacterium sp.]|nr:cold shock domain-containing protein [Mycobacterium sp.]
MRVTGRIVRFDDIRGYGFISPDIGGDDIFLHANDLELDRALVKPSARVSFEIEDGPRGKFATAVQLPVGEPAPAVSRAEDTVLASDEYTDVLSVGEFRRTVTEILLEGAPTITGQQIQQVRMAFETLARKYGWVD